MGKSLSGGGSPSHEATLHAFVITGRKPSFSLSETVTEKSLFNVSRIFTCLRNKQLKYSSISTHKHCCRRASCFLAARLNSSSMGLPIICINCFIWQTLRVANTNTGFRCHTGCTAITFICNQSDKHFSRFSGVCFT